MYISGNAVTFQSRQHQLGNESGAYTSFYSEYQNYSGLMDANWNQKVLKEFKAISGRLHLTTSTTTLPDLEAFNFVDIFGPNIYMGETRPEIRFFSPYAPMTPIEHPESVTSIDIYRIVDGGYHAEPDWASTTVYENIPFSGDIIWYDMDNAVASPQVNSYYYYLAVVKGDGINYSANPPKSAGHAMEIFVEV